MYPSRLAVAVTAALALSSSCCPRQHATGPVAVAPSAAPAATPNPFPDLNLDFEDGRRGWYTGGKGYDVGPDDTQHHSGSQSMRLEHRSGGAQDYGVVTGVLPIERVRGKRVGYRAWIMTQGVAAAGLWMRVDDADQQVLAFANMQDRPIQGTTPWTRYEITLDVAREAKVVAVGVIHEGTGTMWVDDMSFELSEGSVPEAGAPVMIAGVVTDPAGKLVEGAFVALVAPWQTDATSVVVSGADGRFAIEAPAGKYALTATSSRGVAAYDEMRQRTSRDGDVSMVLGSEGILLGGTVTVTGGAIPPDTRIVAVRHSKLEGDLFYGDVDEKGAFSLRLPRALYDLRLVGGGFLTEPTTTSKIEDQNVVVAAVRLAPPPEEVVAWIKKAAVPLMTVVAEHGFDDLRPLAKIVGGARIVALGEATHGTREFFQMKHRMVEYLVSELGFTVFAMETNWPESELVNEYIVTGNGTATQALSALSFAVWYTEEVAELIEWMRRWNADPKHKKKVRFYGFDMQTSHAAFERLHRWFEQVDMEYAKTMAAALSPLVDPKASVTYADLSANERAVVRVALDDVSSRLAANKRHYVKASSVEAWTVAAHQARVLSQTEEMYVADVQGDPMAGMNVRDRAMAENIDWILATEPGGTRIVVWAHNGHVASEEASFTSMGSHLKKTHGKKYLPLGFVFAEGSFQAHDTTANMALREVTLGPAPDADVSAAFTRAGWPLCVLDLRRAPKGVVADWFEALRPMREAGAGVTPEAAMSTPQRLSRRFDGIIFVEKTTRARPPNLQGKR